jgi:hypothetical protein
VVYIGISPTPYFQVVLISSHLEISSCKLPLVNLDSIFDEFSSKFQPRLVEFFFGNIHGVIESRGESVTTKINPQIL